MIPMRYLDGVKLLFASPANFEDIYENRKLIVVIDLHAIVIEIYMFDDFT